jgi:hypothetical protein
VKEDREVRPRVLSPAQLNSDEIRCYVPVLCINTPIGPSRHVQYMKHGLNVSAKCWCGTLIIKNF